MPQPAPAVPGRTDLDALSALLKATSDPLRLKILQILGHDSFAVLELAGMLDILQSGTSHHLKVLARAGLVEQRREGNTIFYRRHLPEAEDPLAPVHRALLERLDALDLPADVASRLDAVQRQRAAQCREFFERHAQEAAPGDEALIADLAEYGPLAREMILRARPGTGGEALEVGPGDGRFLLELARDFDQVTGLDSSEGMLRQARARSAGHDRIRLLQGAWPDDAPPRQFDTVVMNMVLHHLPAPAQALLRAARRLRRGGVLLLTELRRHDQPWTRERCGDLWQGFEEDELIDWATRAGLALYESQYLALRNGFQILVLSFRHPDDPTTT